jgi:hypothetical protein
VQARLTLTVPTCWIMPSERHDLSPLHQCTVFYDPRWYEY